MTLIGARLEALAETMICLIGASGEDEGKGGMIPAEEPVRILSGQRLRVAQIRGAARAYLCVKGGFAQPAGFQISPRLVAGDLLAAASHVPASSRPFARTRRSEAAEEAVVRVVLDPRGGPFSTAGIATLFSTSFRVSASSDRRGIRLEGAPIELSEAPDVPPEGTPLGGIQVARDGMPIVLGPDRPVTGGYARIGTIIQADFPLIAERPPGSVVRFRGVSLAEALAARVG